MSREKKISTLLQLFKSCQVWVDGAPVEKVLFYPVKGIGENQVVSLSWKEKGKEFTIIITEDGLAYADILSSSLDIEDHEGEPANIVFTKPDGKPVSIEA